MAGEMILAVNEWELSKGLLDGGLSSLPYGPLHVVAWASS